jgi:hypothetical protein
MITSNSNKDDNSYATYLELQALNKILTQVRNPITIHSQTEHANQLTKLYLISSFRRVLNVVCDLLGCSPACGDSWPMFWNNVSVPTSKASGYPPMKKEQTQRSETSAIKHHTLGNNPKAYTQ